MKGLSTTELVRARLADRATRSLRDRHSSREHRSLGRMPRRADGTGAAFSCLSESQAETSDRRALGENAVGFRERRAERTHADITSNRAHRTKSQLCAVPLVSVSKKHDRSHAATTE